MANNRMYLIYRPTGDAVYLGKSMGWGWCGTPENVAQCISALFHKAEVAAAEGDFSQDNFAIELESNGKARTMKLVVIPQAKQDAWSKGYFAGKSRARWEVFIVLAVIYFSIAAVGRYIGG